MKLRWRNQRAAPLSSQAGFSQSSSEILLPFSQVRTDRAGKQLDAHALQELSALSARGHVTPAATLLHTCASFAATLSLAAAADKSGPQRNTSEREEGRREGKINRFQSAFFQSRLQTADNTVGNNTPQHAFN